jgi:uncharacterized lipoprotein NlpE involved in copper resistance
MKRKIILGLLIVAVVGIYIGYRKYHEKNDDLSGKKADASLNASTLIAAFAADTASANRQYMDKVIAVAGKVTKIDADGNPVVIFLGADGQMSTVKCSMDSTYADEYKNISEGTQVKLKGICTGGQTEDLFGTDVTLKRCVVEK